MELRELKGVGTVPPPEPRQVLPSISLPLVSIRPPGRWSPLALGELWQYRDLLITLAMRDIKVRYKQTAIGVIWVVLQPLLGAGIFSFVFGKVAGLPSDGLPYIVFSYAGLLGWQAFNTTLTKTSACVVANSQLVSKIFFPRLILPLSVVLSTLIDFAVGLAVMFVLMLVFGIVPGTGIFLMPLFLLMLITFAMGLGLFTSALMVEYRDLNYAIPVLLQFLLYASPVAYSVSAVPIRLRALYFLNPVSGLLEAFRWSLLNRGEIHFSYLAYSSTAVIVTFLVGTFAFKRLERRFADVI